MTTFIDLIPDSREICIKELINRTVQEPSKKEFDELEEKDRLIQELQMERGRLQDENRISRMSL